MSDLPPPSPVPGFNPPGEPNPADHQTQRISHNPVAARVPERVGRGVMATGLLVFTGPHEFVLDFLQGLSRPPQLVARVALSHAVMAQFHLALRDNFARYTNLYGTPPAIPRPINEKPPTAQEIYAELKIPEDLMSGSYANTVLIRHSPAEFDLDFVTNFYPNAAVSSRVYLAAPRVMTVLDTIAGALANLRRPRGE